MHGHLNRMRDIHKVQDIHFNHVCCRDVAARVLIDVLQWPEARRGQDKPTVAPSCSSGTSVLNEN